MYLIDTHAHIYLNQFDKDRDNVVNNALKNNVKKILLPNIDCNTIIRLKKCANKYNVCYPMMGLHPCSVKKDYIKNLSIIENELFENKEKYIAIGEIGIDLYWDKKFVKEQKDAFLTQLRWSKELKLPVVIHIRDSFKETLQLVEKEQNGTLSGVFHCFTGNIDYVKKINELKNFYFGIGGILTFKNSSLQNTVKEIPDDKILLETDSPYLSPVPFRAKRNESSYLKYIAEKLASTLSLEYEKIVKITSNNAEKLFFKKDY